MPENEKQKCCVIGKIPKDHTKAGKALTDSV